jgi:hypothetical protein
MLLPSVLLIILTYLEILQIVISKIVHQIDTVSFVESIYPFCTRVSDHVPVWYVRLFSPKDFD